MICEVWRRGGKWPVCFEIHPDCNFQFRKLLRHDCCLSVERFMGSVSWSLAQIISFYYMCCCVNVKVVLIYSEIYVVFMDKCKWPCTFSVFSRVQASLNKICMSRMRPEPEKSTLCSLMSNKQRSEAFPSHVCFDSASWRQSGEVLMLAVLEKVRSEIPRLPHLK